MLEARAPKPLGAAIVFAALILWLVYVSFKNDVLSPAEAPKPVPPPAVTSSPAKN